MRSFVSIFLFVLFALYASAQDVHLTQYYTSNMSLNPAYIGNYDGDVHAVVNSRVQWAELSKSIKTNMFSVEKKIMGHTSEIAVGGIFINDQLNSLYLNTNKIIVGVSYKKKVGKNDLRFGIQAGTVFRNINLNGQTLPDQWNYATGIFDPAIANGESNLQNSWMYPDVNAGIAWSRMFKGLKLSAGYAAFHANNPKEKISGYSQGVPFRHVFDASAAINLSPDWWLTPRLLYMTTVQATDFISALNAHKKIKENISILFGFGYRGSTANSDAVLATAGLTYNRFTFGISRDFTVSSLRVATNYNYAWEISLSYTTPSRRLGKITVPCERY